MGEHAWYTVICTSVWYNRNTKSHASIRVKWSYQIKHWNKGCAKNKYKVCSTCNFEDIVQTTWFRSSSSLQCTLNLNCHVFTVGFRQINVKDHYKRIWRPRLKCIRNSHCECKNCSKLFICKDGTIFLWWGICSKSCGSDNMFPPDVFCFGSDANTNYVFIYSMLLEV